MVNANRRPSGGSKNWEPGDQVAIGYMQLIVGRRIPTPGDGKPDKWLVHSLDGTRDYHFQPYSGLKMVADRRPPKTHHPTSSGLPLDKPSRVLRVTPDKGIGRDAKTGTKQMVARLERLESLLERLDRSLPIPTQRYHKPKIGGTKGKG
jgi:hypothetical protein